MVMLSKESPPSASNPSEDEDDDVDMPWSGSSGKGKGLMSVEGVCGERPMMCFKKVAPDLIVSSNKLLAPFKQHPTWKPPPCNHNHEVNSPAS